MRIESSTTGDRRLRLLIFLVMCLGMAGWFGYDGWRNYPAKNLAWALESMPVKPEEPRTNPRATVETLNQITPGMTAAQVSERLGPATQMQPETYRFVGEKLAVTATVAQGKVVDLTQEEVKAPNPAQHPNYRVTPMVLATVREGITTEELKQRLGEPTEVQPMTLWFVGATAYAKVELDDGKVAGVQVEKNSERTKSDILLQKILSIVLGLWGLLVLAKCLSAIRLRIVLDDDGLTWNHLKLAWDRMSGLDISGYPDKGWVDLSHDRQRIPPLPLGLRLLLGVRTAALRVAFIGAAVDAMVRDLVPSAFPLRLDSYHIRRFDEIVTAICEKKGFVSPLQEPADASSAAAENPPTDSTPQV